MEPDEAERMFDEFAEAYRLWWGPIIAPAAIGVLDEVGPADDAAAFDLLDLGTGTGVLAVGALERWPGARVVGVDPSSKMLELAAEEARRGSTEGRDGRLRLLTAAAEKLPLPDQSIDVAVSSFVLQLVASRAAALREVLRVLRPGGRFALVTWQDDDLRFEPDAIFGDALDELQIIPPPDERDIHPYSSSRAAASELRRAGFRDVRAWPDTLEHRFTAQTYLDVLEHWIDRELFADLDEVTRRELRERSIKMMEGLRDNAFTWRRPLVRAVGTRPASRSR